MFCERSGGRAAVSQESVHEAAGATGHRRGQDGERQEVGLDRLLGRSGQTVGELVPTELSEVFLQLLHRVGGWLGQGAGQDPGAPGVPSREVFGLVRAHASLPEGVVPVSQGAAGVERAHLGGHGGLSGGRAVDSNVAGHAVRGGAERGALRDAVSVLHAEDGRACGGV